MKTVTQNHTHFSLPVDVRFLAIRATWTAAENSDGERVLFPAINQNGKRNTSPVASPDDIRRRFLKIDFDEDSALDFLNGIGVWSAIPDMKVQDWKDSSTDARLRAMRLWGAFGYRAVYGRALIVTVESLKDEQNYWRQLLPRSSQSRAKLRAVFGPAPKDEPIGLKEHRAFMDALGFGNTLPVHLEWREKHPHAIIQPVTGREVLASLAWVDLVTGAEVKVCQNLRCGEEFTRGGYKFCSPQCEHANTTRNYRMGLKAKGESSPRRKVRP
jgi:hypothetical protein